MKRFLALLLAAFMVCSAFMIPVSATRDYVISPEYSGGGSDPLPPPEEIPEEPVPEEPAPDQPTPDQPVPEEPGVEIPEEPVPEAPAKPTSPQTGYTMGVTGLMAAAAAFGTVAVVAGKKASSR